MDDPIIYRDRTGDALRASLAAFCFGGRRTGRTERMIKMLRPGDRVICANHVEAELLRQRLKQRGLEDIEVVAGAPHKGEPIGANCAFLHERRPTHFTHEWYEAYYANELKVIEHRLDELHQIVQGPRKDLGLVGG